MVAHRMGTDLLLAATNRHLDMTDPGDEGTIKCTENPQYVPLVSAGAETRTLADPDGPNQFLQLGFLTDGGDITITSSSPINQAGSTTMVFSDIGESILLVSMEDSAGSFEWRIVARDGVVVTDAAEDFTDLTVTNLVVSGLYRVTGVQGVKQGAPTAETDTATLTIAELLTGIIQGTPTAAATYTLPTGTLSDAGMPADFAAGDAFDWSVINLATTAGYDITIAAGTGHTVVGDMVVDSQDADGNNATGLFRSRKTAANTFITYRIA